LAWSTSWSRPQSIRWSARNVMKEGAPKAGLPAD
jgi:hypothetical protein